jgi:hypothetical protein
MGRETGLALAFIALVLKPKEERRSYTATWFCDSCRSFLNSAMSKRFVPPLAEIRFTAKQHFHFAMHLHRYTVLYGEFFVQPFPLQQLLLNRLKK